MMVSRHSVWMLYEEDCVFVGTEEKITNCTAKKKTACGEHRCVDWVVEHDSVDVLFYGRHVYPSTLV